MRFSEIIREGDPQDGHSVLLTTLEFLTQRSADAGAPMSISTQSLINTVRNTGAIFDYAGLVAAYKDPAVKELIKSFNKDVVTFKGANDIDAEQGDVDLGTDTVARMASKALTKRT
tara:strand:+ start:135 stop:482 length:348 start_codon:yes stop_codon:yes gene_type:complete